MAHDEILMLLVVAAFAGGAGLTAAGVVLGPLVPLGATLLWLGLRLPVYEPEAQGEPSVVSVHVTGPGPVPVLSAEAR